MTESRGSRMKSRNDDEDDDQAIGLGDDEKC